MTVIPLRRERYRRHGLAYARQAARLARAEDHVPPLRATRGVEPRQRRRLGVEPQTRAVRGLVEIQVGIAPRHVAGIHEEGGVEVLPHREARLRAGDEQVAVVELEVV